MLSLIQYIMSTLFTSSLNVVIGVWRHSSKGRWQRRVVFCLLFLWSYDQLLINVFAHVQFFITLLALIGLFWLIYVYENTSQTYTILLVELYNSIWTLRYL